jgi:hypothetical protein
LQLLRLELGLISRQPVKTPAQPSFF